MEIDKEKTNKLIKTVYDKERNTAKYFFVRALLVANPNTAYNTKEIKQGLEQIGITTAVNSINNSLKNMPDGLVKTSYYRHPKYNFPVAQYQVGDSREAQLFVQFAQTL